jgi:hypothetical protein
MHEVAEKRGTVPKEYRCPKNFPMEKSAKSMEGIGAVEHCKTIFKRSNDTARAYIRRIVTDDDSSTRSNLRWPISIALDKQYSKGQWNRKDHWPINPATDKPYTAAANNGLMPEWVPQVLLYLCDLSHRVKCIGSICYKIKAGHDPRPTPEETVVVIDNDGEDDGKHQAMSYTQKWPIRRRHQRQGKKKRKHGRTVQQKKRSTDQGTRCRSMTVRRSKYCLATF